MKIEIGKEVVITRGMRPEENPWGAYQFPIPYRTDSGIVVSVHVADDTFEEYGNRKWFLSKDGGETWTEVPCSVEEECGIVLRNGDRISFPMQKAVELKGYQMIDWKMLTPDYIFSEQAPEGVLPIQDGMVVRGRLYASRKAGKFYKPSARGFAASLLYPLNNHP